MKIFKNAVSIAIAALFTFSVILGSFTVTAKTEQTYVSADQFRSSEKIFFQDADRIVNNCKFHVIQQFAFTNDNKYIFATQEATPEPYKKKNPVHTGLTMFKMSHDGVTARKTNSVVLKNYGHGEAVSVTTPDNKKDVHYVWVISGANKKTFGTTITRLTCKIIHDKFKITDRITIDKLNHSIVKVKKIKKKIKKKKITKKIRVSKKFPYTFERAGIGVNQASNRIAFRVCFKPGQGCNYVIYDYKKLNFALDKALKKKHRKYSLNKAENFQYANVRTSLKPTTGVTGAFQSFDLNDKNLFIAGNHQKMQGKYPIGIYRIPYKTTIKEIRKNEMSHIAHNIQIEAPKFAEMEGLKAVQKDNKTTFYFNTFPGYVPLMNSQSIHILEV